MLKSWEFIMSSLINLSDYLGIIKIAGQDSAKFAQGQFSCDVQEVSPTLSRLGCHCTPQGRIIAIFRILKWQNDYLLILPKNLIAEFLIHIKKYAAFFKCSLSDSSKDFSLAGLISPEDEKVKLPLNRDEVLVDENKYIVKHSDLAQYLILSEKSAEAQSESQLTYQEWQLVSIRAGIPWIYPNTKELFLPHRLNLQCLNAISFSKGCYTGQEVVARTHYLGKLKYHMYPILVSAKDNIQPDTEIVDTTSGQVVGKIVDACENENGAYECLAVLPNDLSQLERLRIGNKEGPAFTRLLLPYAL